MNTKELIQEAVVRFEEEDRLDTIVEKSLDLAISIQKLKKINFKEDYLSYSIAYNKVCEKIADMRLIIDQAEFLFNLNEIEKHYQNKIFQLEKELEN